ncbi:hypothetical protein HYU10_03400 [Candidatus Woesearchaeota archaeon]|nr:hypothetical protein [Candidatus Woesearchaeota archaeon]MBI2660712.1 hypothetical protein [Candidatus Woesearchaeota archaeon]
MQITIDTANDSHENIRKAIKMLQSIVGEGAVSNIDEAAESEKGGSDLFGNAQGGLFSNASEPAPQQEDGQKAESMMSMFSEQPSSPIQILADGPSPKNSTIIEQKQADEEPIGDDSLFADLFTKEELEKMGKKEESKAPDADKYSARVYF